MKKIFLFLICLHYYEVQAQFKNIDELCSNYWSYVELDANQEIAYSFKIVLKKINDNKFIGYYCATAYLKTDCGDGEYEEDYLINGYIRDGIAYITFDGYCGYINGKAKIEKISNNQIRWIEINPLQETYNGIPNCFVAKDMILTK